MDGSGAGLGCGLGQLGLVLANSAAFVGSQNKAMGRAKSGQRARNGATGQGNKGTAAFQFFILGLGPGASGAEAELQSGWGWTRLGLPRLVASKTSRPEKGREQKLCEGEQTAGQSQGSVQRKAGQERNRTMQQTSCGFPHRWFKFAI